MAPKRSAKSKVKAEEITSRQTVGEVSPEPGQADIANKQSPSDGTNGKQSGRKQEVGSRPKDQPEPPTKKRKNNVEASNRPPKALRRSARGAQKSRPSEEQLLRYMLSKPAGELCRPEDEKEDMKSRGNIRTYTSTVLSPFEELLCAVILSRPISHRLGMRSIRTILNDPYNFTSPKAIQTAGSEKRHQALWDAKTQHKGKTADQIGQVADVVLSKFTSSKDKTGTRLSKALEDGRNDIDTALDLLKENIKGLGKTGLDIFLRRVQWIWDVGFPFVDDRTSQSLKSLGLPQDAEELASVIDEHWSKLDIKSLAGDDQKVKKRRAFVVVLERAIGADLEGKVDELLEAAATS